MTQLLRVFSLVIAVFGASLLIGCDDPLGLPPPSLANVVDTVRLYALRGTPVAQPSGLDVRIGQVVRTEQPGWDIAFDIDDAGTPLVYPAGALGLPPNAGVLKMNATFDEVTTAPTGNDYVVSQPLAIPKETVFVVRSAPHVGDCGFTGALPRYGKFRVLSVDPTTRSVALEMLVDLNCGYRDLKPGVPTA